jgi:hypothetical protein
MRLCLTTTNLSPMVFEERAPLLFATDAQNSRLGVCLAASGALVLASLLTVIGGGQIGGYISPPHLDAHGRSWLLSPLEAGID